VLPYKSDGHEDCHDISMDASLCPCMTLMLGYTALPDVCLLQDKSWVRRTLGTAASIGNNIQECMTNRRTYGPVSTVTV